MARILGFAELHSRMTSLYTEVGCGVFSRSFQHSLLILAALANVMLNEYIKKLHVLKEGPILMQKLRKWSLYPWCLEAFLSFILNVS